MRKKYCPGNKISLPVYFAFLSSLPFREQIEYLLSYFRAFFLMRVKIALFFVGNASASLNSRADFCSRLAQENFNKLSMCNTESGKCENLYWDSTDKTVIKYSDVGLKNAPVSCFAAKSLFDGAGGKSIPDWYDDSKSKVENLELGLSSILGRISSELTPRLALWPVGALGREEKSTASRIVEEVQFIKKFLNIEDVLEIRQYLATFRTENLHWRHWRMYLEDWLEDASFLRLDQGDLLKLLFPYLQVHRVLLDVVFAMDALRSARERFQFPAVLEMDHEIFSLGNFRPESAYSPFKGKVENMVPIANALRNRAVQMWPVLSDSGRRIWAVADFEEKDKFHSFDKYFLRLMMSSGDRQNVGDIRDLLCPIIVELTAYVSWVWQPPARKANRLIASLNGMLCMQVTSLEDRRRMIPYFPAVLMNSGSMNLKLPSDPSDMVRESLKTLRQTDMNFKLDIIVQFRDTLAAGHTGPRAHWLSVLFEHIFTPGNGFFEYADPISMQHIKPVALSEYKNFDMLAVGRVIGLAIKYGLTIGARITPCGLAMLRLPRESFHLENCVKEEDPIFVSSVNQLAEAFDWENREEAQEYLSTFIEGPEDNLITPETFASFKRHKLYNKGISPIRMSYLFIKKGIRSVLPNGALELFTETEFDIMINGRKTLSAKTLIDGIRFVRQPKGSRIYNWLKEIMEEETDEFRFALNQFVTAVKQPPVRNTSPWIKLEIDPKLDINSLPCAQTCYQILRIPDYPTKHMLKSKLSTAVLEGNASLELN